MLITRFSGLYNQQSMLLNSYWCIECIWLDTCIIYPPPHTGRVNHMPLTTNEKWVPHAMIYQRDSTQKDQDMVCHVKIWYEIRQWHDPIGLIISYITSLEPMPTEKKPTANFKTLSVAIFVSKHLFLFKSEW